MSTTTATVPNADANPTRGRWFLEFLKGELAPYPGRAALVLRMVTAATLAMLVIMAAHLPGGPLGGYFALVITRENLHTTARHTLLAILSFIGATVYIILGVALFVASPVTHFLWVIGSFLLIFFFIRTATNYGVVSGFAFLFATAIPVWDQPGSINVKIALNLYTLFAVCIGSLSVLLVESIYYSFHPVDPILTGLVDRLRVAAAMLDAAASGKLPPKADQARLLQYALTGSALLRRQLIRSNQTGQVRARVTAIISLCGRLVELCAAALDDVAMGRHPEAGAAERLHAVATAVTEQASVLRALKSVAAVGASRLPSWNANLAPSRSIPHLPELERTIEQFGEILNSFGSAKVQQTRSSEADRTSPNRTPPREKAVLAFAQDTLSNREYVVFAMRGCLAASFCFLIYNGVDWPGINTSVTTCIVTGLGTIGSSRQKQILRIAGAILGGFFIALPVQVYVLPHLDTITGFTLVFATVSAFAAWIQTSSPRLSYVGLQIALAFYLVNLSEPYEQISLAIARDRVVGILLGLSMMWLVFDSIAAPHATERMEQLLRFNLEHIGQYGCLIGELAENADQGVLEKARGLRHDINDAFSQMNAQADVVAFEFGPGRAAKLRARERMLAMQPAMRSLFLREIALYEGNHAELNMNRRSGGQPALRFFLERNREALRSLASPPRFQNPLPSPIRPAASDAFTKLRESLESLGQERGEQNEGTWSLCAGIADAAETLRQQAMEKAPTGHNTLAQK